MATATNKRRKAKKVTKPMSKSEFAKKLASISKGLRSNLEEYVENTRPSKRRSYSDPSISRGEKSLAKKIVKSKGGSHRMAEYALNLTVRNGMSAYDLLTKTG